MPGFLRRMTWATIALGVGWGAAWAADAIGPPPATKPALPAVIALADDDCTRGDWIGTYGSYAYLLCGMRAPESLCGGPAAADSKGAPRARLSSAPVVQDRSVLIEPSGLKRTSACWSDEATTDSQARGPALYIRVSVPEGPFLLSLYFFEIDWPQYRAYRIRVLTDEDKPVPLAAASADNFLKGKYKRFIVLGPAKLLVMINGGSSPDAQVSGIFLDALKAPDMQMLDSAVMGGILPTVSPTDGSPDVALAAKSADDALALILASPRETWLQEDYVRQEAAFFNAMRASAQKDPEMYYRNLESRWRAVETRTTRALTVLNGKSTSVAVRLLNYYASRGRCNYEGARQAIRAAVHDLSVAARNSGERSPRQAQLLQDYAVALMQQGHRGEAEIVLRAFAAVCHDLEMAETVREKLLLLGKQALRAGVSLPIAEALTEWESQHGPLSIDDCLLLGNLYYVAGKNDKALAIYQAVEPKLKEGHAHRWLLIAMLTAHLRENRIGEATAIMSRLRATDASAAEVQEGQYRFGAHYFEMREFKKAKQCFIQLRDFSTSADYKQMADEYLGRIEQVAEVKNP